VRAVRSTRTASLASGFAYVAPARVTLAVSLACAIARRRTSIAPAGLQNDTYVALSSAPRAGRRMFFTGETQRGRRRVKGPTVR
jgi:hypothetical protein